ncbi:MAG TPA: hypothetical protein VJT71_03395 [Pyrinomonadaceae bacterium]|nr:hypothetical protein [Pyrinomonadaceae bacterium]
MRFVMVLAVGVLLAASAAAQNRTETTPDAPGVIVTRISWKRVTINPALLEDPMLISQEQSRQISEQRLAREQPLRVRPENAPVTLRSRSKAERVTYVYSARVRNTGDKTIREIGWEYLLSDPETKIEVGRHLHSMKLSLAAGKSRDLIARSSKPPAGVVFVSKNGKEVSAKYSERVIINRLRYADGSVWQRPID